MRNTSFNITGPHLFSPKSAFSAESKSYIITSRFNVYEAFQINQSDFLIFNLAFVREMRWSVCAIQRETQIGFLVLSLYRYLCS